MSASDGLLDDLDALPTLPAGGRLAGRAAVVTGAGSPSADVSGVGIGAATARLFARDGAQVVVADIDEPAGRRTVEAIEKAGGAAVAVKADLTRAGDCQKTVEVALASYGRIDVVVNNLGIDGTGRVDDMTEEAWDRVMAVNVKSMMLMAKHAIAHLAGGGSIVNVTSISATRPMFSRLDYSASKGAVNSLTLALAVQHGREGVRVNGVCPGTPWTAMSARPFAGRNSEELTELRRRRLKMPLLPVEGTAWDIAEAAAFLASDQARWITGQILVVDGGTTLYPHWDELGKR